MKKLPGLIYGSLWGMAHIVPGLSGGTLLVIFDCYDTVCHLFALNIREIKKHILFFIFFIIGAIAGVIGFINVVLYLFDNFTVQTDLFFMGLVIGGIPLILRLAREDENLKPKCLIPFALGLALVLAFYFIESFEVFEAAGEVQGMSLMTIIGLFLGSFGAAIAMVVPGISGASILIAVGLYDTVIEAIKNIDIAVLIPAGAGLVTGIVLGARAILYLMKKSKLMVYSAILGMVIGSVAPLYPEGIGLNVTTLAGIICLCVAAVLTFIIGKQEKAG